MQIEITNVTLSCYPWIFRSSNRQLANITWRICKSQVFRTQIPSKQKTHAFDKPHCCHRSRYTYTHGVKTAIVVNIWEGSGKDWGRIGNPTLYWVFTQLETNVVSIALVIDADGAFSRKRVDVIVKVDAYRFARLTLNSLDW